MKQTLFLVVLLALVALVPFAAAHESPVTDYTGVQVTNILVTDNPEVGHAGPVLSSSDGDLTGPWTELKETDGAEWSARSGHTSVALSDGSIILMGGSDHYAEAGNDVWQSTDNGTTWTQMTESAGWSARSGYTSVVLPDDTIVLMGGYSNGDYRNDVWRSTDNGATWEQVTVSAGWSARSGYTSVALPDGTIVLMGGWGSDGYRNDVWRSTDNGATWERMTESAEWSPRSGHTSVALPDGGIVLMGGYDNCSRNDVWESTDNGATWEQLTASAGWSPRSDHTSVALPDGSIVLMGSGYTNDVWRSIDNGTTWAQITDSAEWSPRSGYASVALPDGSIVLLGGSDHYPEARNDVWRSTDNGGTWEQVTASEGWSPRYGHTSVVCTDGSIFLMGGGSSDGYTNDVWQSTDNGVTWEQMAVNAGWSRRAEHSSVALPDGSIILMGGWKGYYANDVWQSTDNGATWTQVTASAEWSIRSEHTSVVLPDGSIALIGGRNSDKYICDAWRSTDNGATWTQMTASAGWPGRQGHTSVALPDGSIILMGGWSHHVDAGIVYMSDVWRSTNNGATWTQMTASAGWSPRSDHTSVALPDGSIVLMGGQNNDGYMSDIWQSTDNGATWTQTTTSAGWSARFDHTGVVLPDGSIVLMGGRNNDGYMNDVWRLETGIHSADTILSFDPARSEIQIGEMTEFDVVLNRVPTGLSEFDIRVTLTNTSVGEIVGFSYPSWAFMATNVTLPADAVDLQAADLMNSVEAGATNVTLCTLTVRGDIAGETGLTIVTAEVDDDASGRYAPETADAVLVVEGQGVHAVAFTTNVTSGIAPFAIQFTDLSTGNPTTWLWDFGDGSTSTEQHPTHTYLAAGIYYVNLTVSSSEGSSTLTQTDPIVALRYGDINFDGRVSLIDALTVLQHAVGLRNITEPLALMQGDLHQNGFLDIGDAQIIAHYDVGLDTLTPRISETDSNSSVELIVAPGARTIPAGEQAALNITLVDAENVGSYNIMLRWDPAVLELIPQDNITFQDLGVQNVTAGEARLAGILLKPANEDLTLCTLKFTAIGSPGSSSLVTIPNREYSILKAYSCNAVPFTVSTATVTISEPAPAANFTANVTAGPAPLTVQFTDLSTGNPTAWLWGFGDGSTSTEQHPIHTYTAAGTYTVSLTVTGAGGSNVTTMTHYVTVADAMPIVLSNAGAAKGQTTQALLTIRNASAVGAGCLDLTYDPAVVTVDAMYLASPWEGASNINNTNGKARISYFTTRGQSGDVPICTVTLRATGEHGDTCLLNITVDVLASVDGKDLSFAALPVPGEFQVLYPDTSDPIRYRDAANLYKGILSGNTLYFGEEDLNLTSLGSVEQLVHYSNFSVGIVNATIDVPDCRSFNPTPGESLIPGRYYAWGNNGPLNGWPWVEIREPYTGLEILLSGTNTSVDGTSLTCDAVVDVALENNLEGLHTTPAAAFVDIEITAPGGGRLKQFGGADLSGVPINASTVYVHGIALSDAEPGPYTAKAVWSSTSDFAGKGYDSNTVTFEIVGSTLLANFTANATAGLAPLAVQFTDTSTGNPIAWSWTFGDSAISTEQHPVHTYTVPGTYTVSLTVTNSAGSNTTTLADYITVSPRQDILWEVPLSVTSGTFGRTVTLGSAESATREFDAGLDVPMPPDAPGAKKSVYFTSTDLPFEALSADYRPPIDDTNPEEVWTLCIRSDEPVQVAWNTTLLAGSEFFLTWNNGTNTIAMKATNATTLPAGSCNITISASTAQQIDLPLQVGWNLVSVPFNGAEYTVPQNAILAIYGYNPSTKGYETVSRIESLVPGRAYWVASSRDCTVTVTGTPISPVTAHLKQGWNLIGSTAGQSAFDSIAITPTGSWAMSFVYGYDSQTKGYGQSTELQPGEGYWGAVTRDCTITLS